MVDHLHLLADGSADEYCFCFIQPTHRRRLSHRRYRRVRRGTGCASSAGRTRRPPVRAWPAAPAQLWSAPRPDEGQRLSARNAQRICATRCPVLVRRAELCQEGHRRGTPGVIVFGYGAGGMRRPLLPRASQPALLLAAASFRPRPPPTAGSRLVDVATASPPHQRPRPIRATAACRAPSGTSVGAARLPRRSGTQLRGRHPGDLARGHRREPGAGRSRGADLSRDSIPVRSRPGRSRADAAHAEDRVGLGVADRCDPRESIRGGVRHLRYLLERYRGSVVLAYAAYNAGKARLIPIAGVPPIPRRSSTSGACWGVPGPRRLAGEREALYATRGPTTSDVRQPAASPSTLRQ